MIKRILLCLAFLCALKSMQAQEQILDSIVSRSAFVLGFIDYPVLRADANPELNKALSKFNFTDERVKNIFLEAVSGLDSQDVTVQQILLFYTIESQWLTDYLDSTLVFSAPKKYSDDTQKIKSLKLGAHSLSLAPYLSDYHSDTDEVLSEINRVGYFDPTSISAEDQLSLILGFIASRASFNEELGQGENRREGKYTLSFSAEGDHFSQAMFYLFGLNSFEVVSVSEQSRGDGEEEFFDVDWEFQVPEEHAAQVNRLIHAKLGQH